MRYETIEEFLESHCSGGKRIYSNPVVDQKDKSSYLFLLYKGLLTNSNDLLVQENIGLTNILKDQIKNGGCVFHQHWIETRSRQLLLRTFQLIIFTLVFRMVGGQIIWTIHNLIPHDSDHPKFDKIIGKIFSALSSLVHVHSNYAKLEVIKFFRISEKKVVIVPHPKYLAQIKDQKIARDFITQKWFNSLRNTDTLILMFGKIKPYKDVEMVIEAVEKADNSNVKLLVIGKIESYGKNKKPDSSSENVKVVDCFISSDELPFLISASDFVLFNFTKILTSGSVRLALDYEKKIMCKKLDYFADHDGDENFIFFDNLENLVSTLKNLNK